MEKKKQIKVSVIIPNYNGRELLEKNLPSVVKASRNPENHIEEIIIVDDASGDESVAYVKSQIAKLKTTTQRLKLLQRKNNGGFAESVNVGVANAKGNLICLLNSDVSVSENFLISTLPLFAKKSAFAVSLHEKGFGYAKGVFKDGFIVHTPGEESDKVRETFWVSGGSGVFRKSIWDKLGGMDAKLLSPYYWEDIDLSYRAAKRGYILLWDPRANVVHEHESSMRKIDKKKLDLIRERNQLIFIWKNLTGKPMFKRHIFGMIRKVASHPGYFKVVFAALLKLPLIIAARKKETREGAISDEAIFARFAW